jgi:group I intron endonuclease
MVPQMNYIFPFEEIYYIYKITNSLNNKIYVGRTKNPAYRHRQHISLANRYDDYSDVVGAQKIHIAIKELGSENFTFEVFEKCNNYSNACEREIHWIKEYRSDQEQFGYNDKSGPDFGVIMWSEEDRQRMSLRMSGDNNPMFGKPKSKEMLQQLSENFSGTGNPFYGKTHTNEAKKLIGISSKERVAGENNPHAKLTLEIVAQIRKDWKTGNYTKVALSKKYGVTAVTIGNIVSGKTWK